MHESLDNKRLREFGLVTGATLALLFGLLLPFVFDRPWPYWPWVAGATLALWGLAWPAGLRPVYHGWMRFGHVLGWINSRIILALMFYALVLPAGVMMRLLGRDPMRRRRDGTAATYRVASRTPPGNHMERPF